MKLALAFFSSTLISLNGSHSVLGTTTSSISHRTRTDRLGLPHKSSIDIPRALNDAAQYDANNQYDAYNDANEEEEDPYAFLQRYEQVYLTCDPNKEILNANTGYTEVGAVIFRLCYLDSDRAYLGAECNSKGRKICPAFGDYVVGLDTYLYWFWEQFQKDNAGGQNNGGGFNFEEFAECKRLQVNDDNQNYNDYNHYNYYPQNDGDGDDEQEMGYYVGPMCTKDGTIKIALFNSPVPNGNEYESPCRPEYEAKNGGVTFETLTGMSLPWSTSIWENDAECHSYFCNVVADEDGNYEYSDLCTNLYDEATLRCEAKMEFPSDETETDTSGCDEIYAMLPRAWSESGGGSTKWIVVGFLLGTAAIFSAVWWYAKKTEEPSAASAELNPKDAAVPLRVQSLSSFKSSTTKDNDGILL